MGVRPQHLMPGQPVNLAGLDWLCDAGTAQLLFFERGHWCAACRRHLTQLADHWDAFEALPTDIHAITHEPLAETLGHGYPFPLIADPDLVLAVRFGLVHIDEYGMTTVRPAVILIDESATIRFSYVGDDSRDRPTVPALLLALNSILG